MLAAGVVDILETAGFAVVGPPPTVEQAMAPIAANTIDCAVLDVTLTDTDSFPIADALEWRRVPFVLVTGYNRHDLPVRFRKHPLLVKPVSEVNLRRAVTTLLS
jgi:DNA-binding response OmpR family regulator